MGESIKNTLIKRQTDTEMPNNSTMNGFLAEVRNEFSQVNPIIFIVIGVFIILLLIFYVIARCRYPKGKSVVIFTATLTAVDLCLDIVFLINSVREVPELFIPSLLALLIPAGFNFLFALGIMTQQACVGGSTKFKDWLHKHSAVAGIFTILSLYHIEVLRLLTSYFLELEVFNAPFDNSAKKWIFGAGLFNFIIEDIPQFVILILYFKAIGPDFTLIPILTLFVCSIYLLTGLLSRFYEFISFPTRKVRSK